MKIQFFNESVLGSAPTDSIQMLLPNAVATWSPNKIVLDYKGNSCYGAIVHYERLETFESLRRGINSRFGEYEQAMFANNPNMGIWRIEDSGFTIQLSDSEDEDSYTVIYIRFVDLANMAEKICGLVQSAPALFDGLSAEELIRSAQDMDEKGFLGSEVD